MLVAHLVFGVCINDIFLDVDVVQRALNYRPRKFGSHHPILVAQEPSPTTWPFGCRRSISDISKTCQDTRCSQPDHQNLGREYALNRVSNLRR